MPVTSPPTPQQPKIKRKKPTKTNRIIIFEEETDLRGLTT
jgi:hypothetical protein